MEHLQTNATLFEKELAFGRASFTKAPTKQQMTEDEYQRIRTFFLTNDIMAGTQRVLDAGVRNLDHERGDRVEFALAINEV